MLVVVKRIKEVFLGGLVVYVPKYMAAGTGFSRSCVTVEDGFSNDMSSGVEGKSHNSDQLNELDVGKPPRHVSVVRHSVSTATLLTTPADQVYESFQS